MVRQLGLVFAAMCVSGPAMVLADVPQFINQEGVLIGDDLGDEVEMRFDLFERLAGGEPIWSETFDAVELFDGWYNVVLGLTQDLDAEVLAGARYLGVTVDGEPLTPRIRLASVPYSLVAHSVSGGTVDATTLSIDGETIIDAEGRWRGDPAGLRGPAGAEGPRGAQGAQGEQGPPGNQGSPDTAADILRKLRTLEGPIALSVETAGNAQNLGGRAPGDYLRKAEVGVDIAGGAMTLGNAALVFKADDARDQISDVRNTASVANDAAAGALVVAGRRGANDADRRIELRGRTQVRGNLVATGQTVLQGGLFVSNPAGGGVRQVIDANGRWVPNAGPLVGRQCDEGLVFRGLADDGSLICEEGGVGPAECGLPIPCEGDAVAGGWGQKEYDEDTEVWSPCIMKGCYRPARLVVADANRPWLNRCQEDENNNEKCNDGRDNDGDGNVDCTDSDCAENDEVDVCSTDLEIRANQVFNINTMDAAGEGGVDAPMYRLAQNASADARQLVLDQAPRALNAGDEVLVITLKRVNGNANSIGSYETARVASSDGQRLNLREGLAFDYPGASDVVVVQRIPTYSGVVVRAGGTMTANAFNGSVGGIFAIRVGGQFVIEQNGRVDMDGKGFRGAAVGGGQGFPENWNGRVEDGGGDANRKDGGGAPDANGQGGRGGYCYYRGHEGRGGTSAGTIGQPGQGGGAGGFCHQYYNDTQWSGGGGAPRNAGTNPTVPERLGTRLFMGGGAANGGGGGASGNYYRCGGDRSGKRDGRGGVSPGNGRGCSQNNSIGGHGGDGGEGGGGGGVVLIWAASITANGGTTIRARGGSGGAGGGGGGGAHINGGGGGGAGGGGAAGGTVLIRANTRRIGVANINVTGGIGGGGGGGGGSSHAGPGGAGAGPGGGGGGAGVYYGDRGCLGTNGGDAGQAGEHNNGAGHNGDNASRPCRGRGGAVGGGGGGGGRGTDRAGAANRGGTPGSYRWSGHAPTAGGNASGRNGGNGGWGPVHTAGGAGGRWGPNGAAGIKAIRPL